MGRSSELAQRVVRCVSGEIKGERKIKKENKKKRELDVLAAKGKI